MQKNVLDQYPSSDLAVYAVWLPAFPGDSRDRWNPQLLVDSRITHYWDGQMNIGRWFAALSDFTGVQGAVLWDAYALYGPDAAWGEQPGPLLGWGTPVIRSRDDISREIQPLLVD